MADRRALDERFTPLDIRLPASASQLKHARDCVAAAAAEFGFASKDSFEFVFAVNEAVTNAIKHGGPDRDGTVGLRIDSDGDALVCSVTDCGPFVAPASLPEITAESGRGFAFMATLTDGFELVTETGRTVVRLRKVRREDGEDAGE